VHLSKKPSTVPLAGYTGFYMNQLKLGHTEFQPFEAGSDWFEPAVRVYTTAYNAPRQSTLEFFTEQAQRPDFRGIVTVADDQQVIGAGFGTRSEPGQWWHDAVSEQVGVDHPALQDAWVLVEIVLLADYRGHGIGGQLLDSLLRAQPCSRVVLSVVAGNTLARSFYERRGWNYLHPGIVFGNQKTYAIMHKELLPEPSV
jgi:ribosomal protein S18 acetylase RimI-like enzyme